MAIVGQIDLPVDYFLDDFTRYMFRHFGQLLTQKEVAAHRLLTSRVKRLGARERGWSEGPGLHFEQQVRAEHPDVYAQAQAEGPAMLMARAARRILREERDLVHLNHCPRCRVLCRTPQAQQCFHCGHDWHDAKEVLT
jgi:hypothetical protein